jgi:hypothetical protein
MLWLDNKTPPDWESSSAGGNLELIRAELERGSGERTNESPQAHIGPDSYDRTSA